MPSTRVTQLRAKAATHSTTHPNTHPETHKSPANTCPVPATSIAEPSGPKRSQRLQKKSFKGACLEAENSKRETRSKRNRRTRARNQKAKQADPGPDSSRHDTSSPDPDPFAIFRGDETMGEERTQADGPGDGTQWETSTFIPFPPSRGQETLEWLQDNQAPPLAAPQRQASYNLLPGIPLSVGGGFHHNHPARHVTDTGLVPNPCPVLISSNTSKRPPDTTPDEPSKRARPSPVHDSDTATESEDDLPPVHHPDRSLLTRPAPVAIVAQPPGLPIPPVQPVDIHTRSGPTSPALPSTPAPGDPASRSLPQESIVPETPEPASPAPPSPLPIPSDLEHQPESGLDPLSPSPIPEHEPETRASSHSLGGSYTPGSRPTSERLHLTGYTTPPKSPSRRMRLRELVKKEHLRKAQLATSGQLMFGMPEYMQRLPPPPSQPSPPHRQTNAPRPSDGKQGPAAQPPSGEASQVLASKPLHTYSGSRSHRGSQPDTPRFRLDSDGLPSLISPQLVAQPPVAPVLRMQHDPDPQQAPALHVSSIRISQRVDGPIPLLRMPLAAQIHRRRRASDLRLPSPGPISQCRHNRGRPHPASEARTKAAAYNQQYGKKLATSLRESVTHDVRGVPTTPVRPEETLPDSAEIRMHAAAIAKGTCPGHRRRKRKPLARDTVGIAQHIMALAKRHLFALALLEGVYPTRRLAMFWAGIVYEETWRAELPDVPFEEPTESMLEVLANYIPTLRGEFKLAVRPVVEKEYGFQDHPETNKDIEKNLAIYRTISNNGFHCSSFSPREGHYENPAVGRAMAAAFFGSPGLVGRLYPDYFEEMDLQISAFVLAMMEFRIEEWSTGSHVDRDLNTGRMPERFEVHKKNLENARSVFPDRFVELQENWFATCSKYQVAHSHTEQPAKGIIPINEFRPDTPEPEPEVPEPEVEPEPEYDQDGRLTARSKGKGRAH